LFAEHHEAIGKGVFGQAAYAANVELAHEVIAVGFDGASADVELRGDFFIGEALGDANQNVAFTGTQFAIVGGGIPAHHLLEGDLGDIFAEKGVSALNGVNCFAQLLSGRVLGNVSAGA